MILLPTEVSTAATWNWDVASGNWNVAGYWSPKTVPLSNTADVTVILNNGGETTLTSNWLAGGNSSVTVGTGNTLNLQAVLQLNGTGASFTNNGTVQATSNAGSLRFSSFSAINNHLIQSNDTALLTFWDSSNITNNGTIQSKTGGTIRFWGSNGITGGMLQTEFGGSLLNDASGNSNQTLTLAGVTVNNAGTFTNNQTTNGAATAGTITTALGSGTVFNNAGGAVTEVKNTGNVATTNTNARNSAFNVNNGATFNNEGTLLIQNDAVRIGSTTSQSTTFTVASGATAFSNTGTIQVIANSTGAGATALFTSAKSITNQGVVRVRGKAVDNAINTATFSVTGAGNTYTQSGGANRRTVLERGGVISASTLLIQSGTLGGVGTVSGATTIGADAALIAGDTYEDGLTSGVLTFNQNLTLSNGAEVRFGLGLNTATSGRIVLNTTANLTLGENLTLTLVDITDEGWLVGSTYRLFDLGTGTITGSLNNFSLALPVGWSGTLSMGAGGTDYIDFTLQAIPEPSAALLFAGGLMVTIIFRRRLRQ